MTNTERQAVLNFKITGAETVGEIKGHLKDLKKVLDDTTVGSEEYKKSIKGIADSQKVLTGVMNDTKGAVEHAKGSYYDLNQQLVEARRAYKELSEEERNSAQGTEMLDKIAKLDGELKGLDATMGQYQRNVGHYQLALESLTKQYANQKQELAAMKSAMDNLDPSTREYQQAFERAAEITHNLADRQEILKYSSKDLGDQLSNIRGIASNMAAGFSAAQAAIGLFGGESKEVEKAMLKVQQAMALVQGLQGLDGLIKRTKGLSNALGVAKTATNAQTVALNGETVATEGATVAQKGLNAAMKANPIGVVIIALQALITAWALFKDKIIEAIGGQERLNSIMNNTMPVLAGVGNAILQFVITPVKQFLVSIKGVAVVVDDIIHGKFKQAWKDAGEYAKKWADTTVNGFNVVSNYQKGYSQQVIKITEAETKKKQEEYDKDKENYIKDQEAKYGSDWKWSEEGKKAYEEMYKNRLAMYKKDSEEYRQAQRDMWAYTREYNDRKNKVVTSSVTVTTKANKKIREDSKETAEEIVKDYLDIVKDYSSKVETEAKATADALALAFQNEEFKKGIEYPMTALQYAASELGVWLDTFEKERNEITKVLAEMKEAGLEGTEDYKALQTKLSEIANEESQRRMEYALREAEIYKKTYEMQLDDVERFYKNQERVATNAYNSENFGGDTSNKYYNKSIRNLLSGLMPEQERAMLEEMHKIQMEALEQRRSILEEMANDTSLSHDMRVEAERNLADTIAEIEDKELEHTIEMNQQRIDSWKFYVDMASDACDAIGDLFGNMADFYEADIEAKVKAGKISEGEADRQFENVKKMRIAEAVINTLAGSIGAFLQATATYPPPFGEIIGGVSAAAVAAAGAAQIAKIKSSSRSGSSSVGGEGVMYATASAPQSDYNPQGITNITSGQETQDLRNALMGTNIVVSVTDINDAQKKVAVRDRESTW